MPTWRIGSFGCGPVAASSPTPAPTQTCPSTQPDRRPSARVYGLDFLAFKYDRQWAEGKRRLDHIDKDDLAPDLDDLAGPEFLPEIRHTQAVHGRVLGITEAVDVPLRALGEHLTALRNAMRWYLVKQVGQLDEDAPESLKAMRAALKPVDDYRASLDSSSGGGESEATAEQGPTPEA